MKIKLPINIFLFSVLFPLSIHCQSCELPPTFDSGVVYSRVMYVSPDGSHDSDGKTRDTPLRSLQSALERAVPGTKIVLLPGKHQSGVHVRNVKGTVEAPILITNEGMQDEVVFSGGNTGIQLSDPAYLILENFVVEGASGNGINIDDGGTYDTPAHHVIVRNMHVRDIGPDGNRDGIKLSGLDNFWILDCTIQRPGSGGSAVDMVGCHEGVIAHNRFTDVGSSGVQAKGGSANVLVYANHFERVGQRAVNMGGSTGLDFFRPVDAPFEASNISVVANVFVDVVTPVAFTGCQYGLFAQNTVYLPQRWIARILQESTQPRFVQSSNNVYANNICVIDNRINTLVNIGPNTQPDTFRFMNNLIYNVDGRNTNINLLPGMVESNFSQNPMFTDPERVDFTLQSNSPAIQKGISLHQLIDGLPIQLPEIGDGEGNCWGDVPDIGAFRFMETTGVY